MSTALSGSSSGSADRDRLLLLTIAVILVQNRAPYELVLALLYAAM